MSARDSFPPDPDACFGFIDRKRAASAQHSPRQNRLLAALPLEVYERLLPYLEPVSLPQGWTGDDVGDRQKHLYFLTSGMVVRFYVMKNGASARLAVTGSEGVIGVALLLGGESMPGQMTALSACYAYRLNANLLKDELGQGGPLLQLLLRYTMALIAQTTQIAACNRHHSLKQQLCRWLLLSLDRVPGNELTMTHGLISNVLGVRRESVTDAAQKLQQAGLIHYRRGHITVLDRPLLEAQACECYAVVKREYDRLLPPEIAIANADAHAMEVHDRYSSSRNQSRWPSVNSLAYVPASIRTSTTGARSRFAAGEAQARSVVASG